MSRQPDNSPQIKSEIIRKKLGFGDRVLDALLDGEELSQINISEYIPEMKPHHLSSVICELRNNRLVPILSMWTDDRIKIYWMSDDAIADYFSPDLREEQIRDEGFNVRHKRLGREASASMRFANAVISSDFIADEHSFVRMVVPDLAELFDKANKKISPSSLSAQAQDGAYHINDPDNGGIDGE